MLTQATLPPLDYSNGANLESTITSVLVVIGLAALVYALLYALAAKDEPTGTLYQSQPLFTVRRLK